MQISLVTHFWPSLFPTTLANSYYLKYWSTARPIGLPNIALENSGFPSAFWKVRLCLIFICGFQLGPTGLKLKPKILAFIKDAFVNIQLSPFSATTVWLGSLRPPSHSTLCIFLFSVSAHQHPFPIWLSVPSHMDCIFGFCHYFRRASFILYYSISLVTELLPSLANLLRELPTCRLTVFMPNTVL